MAATLGAERPGPADVEGVMDVAMTVEILIAGAVIAGVVAIVTDQLLGPEDGDDDV